MTAIMRNNVLKMFACVLMLSVSSLIFMSETANANVKHFIVGGLVGAGVVIAWPTITAALGAVGGAVAGAVGTASAAVAVGGAAVGGAVAGAGAAVGGAVTAGFGAIGGGIAAITASPLFVPALLIVAAAIIGFLIYKHYKNKNTSTYNPVTAPTNVSTNSGSSVSILANKNSAPAVTTNSTPATTSASIATTNAAPANATPSTISANKGTERKTNTVEATTAAPASDNLTAAHDKYVTAYKKYIDLLSSSKDSNSGDVQKALQEYKDAFNAYQALLKK